jgi:spermidine synthase
MAPMNDLPEVLDRVAGDRGEVVLRRRGQHFEIISNGTFLMDTTAGASERLLVTSALEALPTARTMLIGGLGVGFTLDEAVRAPGLTSITVVEIEAAVIGWHRTHLRPLTATALDDPRVRVEHADLITWLKTSNETYDVICLDIDNGPEWTVVDENAALYRDHGLALLDRRLRPEGVLAVWSAAASPTFEASLGSVFAEVTVCPVPTTKGGPDVVYVARS